MVVIYDYKRRKLIDVHLVDGISYGALTRQRGNVRMQDLTEGHAASVLARAIIHPAMRVDVGIVGGTGIGSRLADLPGPPVHVPTPVGFLRGKLFTHSGKQVLLISRHAAGHKVPPHKVSYAAMAHGLRGLGAKVCFATAAVGSLRSEWAPGTMAVVQDFVDLTGRNPTLFEREVVHTDFSEPYSASARDLLLRAARQTGTDVKDGGIYVCGNGPRYETPHEIRLMSHIGDVVGMTSATEAILMREGGVPYACLAIVTNLACGISESPLSHEDVVVEMNRSSEKAVELLLKAVELAP